MMILSNKKPALEDIETITAGLEAEMEANDVPMDISMRFSIAVDEIYSNIVYYSGAECARVDCDVTQKYVQLEFCDDGAPYNPLEREDPDIEKSAVERQIGGLGIFLVKRFMDSMDYARENDKNILRMRTDIAGS